VETHILDFQGNLYEKIAKVSFLDFVREERKFESLEALTNQIRKDTQAAFVFFNQM
jgi:riboflavin kinase/FMN adenylyltransferase